MTATTYIPTSSSLLARLQSRWARGISCNSPVAFAFAVSFAWLAFYNVRFWQDTIAAMWHANAASLAFMASLFAFVLCTQALLLLILPRRLMAGAASALFIVASIGDFFSAKYGIVMNKDMMRNVLQTDPAEAHGLLSAALAQWVVLMGILPMILVWRVRFPRVTFGRALRQRALAIGGILLTCMIALLSCSASYAVFFREHKPIRFTLSPAAPVASSLQLLSETSKAGNTGPAVNVSGPAYRVLPPQGKPLVVVIVVGETARAANFQLGGYARDTNPRLTQEQDLVYFGDTTSCGTSTAISVPCMFSHLGRSQFDVNTAGGYTNLLDSLHEAGFEVEWRDNNAGCKGVCKRVNRIDYSQRTDPVRCEQSYCYDEIMLDDMDRRLRDLQGDTVIVMHMIGSHGPAYHERYPPPFEKFKPSCRSNELQHCSAAEVTNAYDNTILYTDYVLAATIDRLRNAADQVDSVLLYASDHGESLGEQGMYLHGLPYTFAPETQKHVPMLLWTSRGFQHRRKLDTPCLMKESTQALSHDNIYHTVLGLAGVRNASYNPALDLIAGCSDSFGGHE
ncbi:MAG TPA: phosphoethanolamine--lipid A transferase [Povalibacter sp.]|uniref:phosphoethanolamine transferase n=1 Tax=Povalibacter sp. TaxID=1962978 RepID=UPI002CB4A570|nr:phosphoethanolamine--lipid A transferase [Povalibacter sp.]HMN46499.1 phosphoethanolamine--lipid A transferase [Povalibacter sp.]